MSETLNRTTAANGAGTDHDTGYSLASAAPPSTEPPAAPSISQLRAEIRDMLAANREPDDEDAKLLALMGQHDAALGAALLKLPERDAAGGAVLAALVRRYRGVIDPYQAARDVATTLIFWPEPVPADEPLIEAALRLAEFNLDAARELARAYTFLGARFTLKFSVRVLLDKYGIRAEQFSAASGTPVGGLTPAGAESMLAQGQLDVLNELLRPFEIELRQKIGTVNPVFSLVEKNNGRAVMPARELIEFLRKRGAFA